MRNPFIAGSWVRAENFFGRRALLGLLLEGERDSVWVIGARRLGKTSLLKQLEYVVQRGAQSPFVPLFLDLQGSVDEKGLADNLLGSVEDSEPFRRATGVSVEQLDGLSASEMLSTLIRRTVKSGWRLLMLIDEGEELLSLARKDPALLPRLRRILQKGPEVRTVLTATRRLARLDQLSELVTSPFLQGFTPPVYLTPLEDDECRELLARGNFSAEETAEIMARAANHPFLVQLIASRVFESRDLVATLDQVSADEMVANFFSVDFQTLDVEERRILEDAARRPGTRRELAQAAALAEDQAEPLVYGLTMLGYLSRDGERFKVGNWFFERWLKRSVGARALEARPS